MIIWHRDVKNKADVSYTTATVTRAYWAGGAERTRSLILNVLFHGESICSRFHVPRSRGIEFLETMGARTCDALAGEKIGAYYSRGLFVGISTLQENEYESEVAA